MAKLYGKEFSRTELLKKVGNISQIAAIKSYQFNQGKANGVKAFDVSTGAGLEFTVLADKCLDILSLKYQGRNLNFSSKPGLVAPEYFNPHGAEFGRCFQGGMLYTCGLSNIGVACSDAGVDYCLHGRIGNTPAENICASTIWDGDEYLMEIRGEMREAALFKESLVLRRSITTQLGSKTLKINDEVENIGYEAQGVMILYHFNFGYPLLDEHTRLLAPILESIPRTEVAKQALADFNKFSAPIDQFPEEVFYHKLAAAKDGRTLAGVVNSELGLRGLRSSMTLVPCRYSQNGNRWPPAIMP